ncbi:hypothetical protein ACJVDH_18080 [Pedobacter sp. AW1-32]|uniref:hypothetical protein n=1 Tax=Pedobacter sp. AW1-32 TaxID=3383026 RepID=UPI003FF1171D
MKAFKKLSLIFSVFLLFYFGEIAVNIACGGEIDPYDYYITYFHNNTSGEEYTPFAFNEMVYLNNENDVESEPATNSREWAKYLNAKEQDVLAVMYKTDSATSQKLSTYSGKVADLPDSLQNNSFLKALSKDKKALKYFLFAKSVEPLANVTFSLWDPQPRDTTAMTEKGNEALANATAEKDTFLKLRYAYQSARMFHYAGNFQQCKDVYEKYIAGTKLNTALKGWALALYAGAVRKLGEPEKAAYLFSKVFASNPERRTQAYKNYYYTSSPLAGALKFANNTDEQVNIWAINGFGNYEYDLKSLNKVYQLSPSSLIVGALMVREINKLEKNLIQASDISNIGYNYYFTDDYRGQKYKDSIKIVNLKQLHDIQNFALKLAAEKKYPQPELGTLTAAYLSWMENKNQDAARYLSQLNAENLTEKLRDQFRITDLLIKSTNIKKGNPFNENELLPTLKWLDEKRFAENKAQPKDKYYYWTDGNNRFTLTTRNFYQQILAPAYMKLGDTAKAALAMVKGDLKYEKLTETSLFKNMSYQTTEFWQRYLSPRSMNGLSIFKSKSSGNDLTALLAKALNQLNNDDFYELFGTTYLRTHQYAKAVEMFGKVSSNYQYFSPENWYSSDSEAKLYANPFIESINDYPKKYVNAKAAVSKKSYAAEMLRLQKLLVSDKKNAALYYYKMANAVYQTGYFGNAWFLISYDWSSYDNTSPVKYVYDADYKTAATAKTWYLKARSLSTDADFRAKCTFMLAKCTQKRIIMSSKINSFSYFDKSDIKWKTFLRANYANPYFQELRMSYSKTPFYQRAAKECSYLGDFIVK